MTLNSNRPALAVRSHDSCVPMMSFVFPNRSYMSWRILRSAFNFAIVLRFEKFSEPFDLSTSTWRVATVSVFPSGESISPLKRFVQSI